MFERDALENLLRGRKSNCITSRRLRVLQACLSSNRSERKNWQIQLKNFDWEKRRQVIA